MNDQPSNWVRTAPGVPVIRNVNWGGLATLYVKEVRRFFKVQLQTIWAPAVTTMLFLVIFPVFTRLRHAAFETRRWAESDHAPESSDESDAGDSDGDD